VGVGVAPSTTENRTQKFVDKVSPFLIEDFHQIRSFKDVLGADLGIAAPAQYREYVGGSTYTANGKEYLKVIGEKYDNQEYTGELNVVNGTPIVGEATTESQAAGLFLPANTKNKNYDEAFKFASWLAGPEGQAILAKGNKMVPNQTSLGMSDEYCESADRLVPNMWVGAYLAQKADIGDYTYFTSLTWITEWSTMFNKEVRNGTVTFESFLAQKQEAANIGLMGMNLYIKGR
jgi:ABC-type glycerol-3-phosphate transport system substrate-binding protein